MNDEFPSNAPPEFTPSRPFYLGLSSWICAGIGTTLLASTFFITDHLQRIVVGTSAITLGFAVELTANEGRRKQQWGNTLENIMLTRGTQAAYVAGRQSYASPDLPGLDEETEAPESAIMDVSELEELDHIGIYAPTGSGKSTFLGFLLDEVLEGKVVYCDPHGSAADDTMPTGGDVKQHIASWLDGGLERIQFGGGRNFDTIFVVLEAIRDVMTHRYEFGGEGVSWEPINLVIEEAPTVVAAWDKKWQPWFTSMIREARKVNIRVILVSQGRNVITLGVKGEGESRDNLTNLFFGKYALRQARQNKLENALQQLQRDMARIGKCVLCEDKALKMPNLSYRSKAKVSSVGLADEARALLNLEPDGLSIIQQRLTEDEREMLYMVNSQEESTHFTARDFQRSKLKNLTAEGIRALMVNLHRLGLVKLTGDGAKIVISKL